MINLSILTDFCSWWWLWWILPFLLGWLFGWSIMRKWKTMYEESQKEIRNLNKRIEDLGGELEECKKKRAELSSNLSLQKGRVKEMEQKLHDSQSELKKLNLEKENQANLASSSIAASTLATSSLVADDTSAEEPKDEPENAGIAPMEAPDKYAKLKSSNLQIIEGIGPKMESVLGENGVNSWADLAGKSKGELQDILNKYGDRYKIIDPTEWPEQARLANTKNWDGLVAFQKSDGSESKAEKVMIKLGIIRQWQQNDLKAIEGIGPKIAELLNNSGIETWSQLADSSVDRIQGILDNAGGRYKLADPGTWPQQAKLAAEAKWDDLEKLQDELNGGK